MRRRPVTRSEIRFDGEQITAFPADAVREDGFGELVPIQKLFAPLLRSLDRSSKYAYEQVAQSRKSFPFLAARAMKPWEPIQCPWPHRRYGRGPHTCRRCGRAFYHSVAGRYLNGTFCSDACAEASWCERRAMRNAAAIEARSEARAIRLAGRRCAYCDRPLMAQRSTKKFCDARCRFGAHWAGRR